MFTKEAVGSLYGDHVIDKVVDIGVTAVATTPGKGEREREG